MSCGTSDVLNYGLIVHSLGTICEAEGGSSQDVSTAQEALGETSTLSRFWQAIMRGEAEVVKNALKDGVDPNVRWVVCHDMSCVRPLTKLPNRTSSNTPALHVAVRCNNAEAVRLLVAAGAKNSTEDVCVCGWRCQILSLLNAHETEPWPHRKGCRATLSFHSHCSALRKC